ncbi:hypothetical protein [Arthrobacter sp. UYCo732]|uniref:hypothetical protein n=1 Tax=Arthrobacter sp. UYCo732 TaxID=3156336 RepID=UPI003391277F
MWWSFWIAVVIGLISAIPIWNHPDHENFWIILGGIATAIQSSVQTAMAPPTIVQRCISGPIPLCYKDKARADELLGSPSEQFWGFIGGILADVAGALTAGVLVILVLSVFVGGSAGRKKLHEVFW